MAVSLQIHNDPRINKQGPGMVFKTKQGAEGRLTLHCYCASFQHFFTGLVVSLGKDFYNLAYPQCQKRFQEMVSHEVKRGGAVTFSYKENYRQYYL